MPYVICPVCGSFFHLSVRGSPDEWAREHVRERNADGIPLLRCFGCWVDLRPGHRVKLRRVPDAFAGVLTAGQEGVVESGAEGEGGAILARFGDTLGSFRREDLSCIPGQKSPPAASDSPAASQGA